MKLTWMKKGDDVEPFQAELEDENGIATICRIAIIGDYQIAITEEGEEILLSANQENAIERFCRSREAEREIPNGID